MHSLRRNSRDCQAKGSSRVVPSRRPCGSKRARQKVGRCAAWKGGGLTRLADAANTPVSLPAR
jgi:hypothetical protein